MSRKTGHKASAQNYIISDYFLINVTVNRNESWVEMDRVIFFWIIYMETRDIFQSWKNVHDLDVNCKGTTDIQRGSPHHMRAPTLFIFTYY